MAFLFAACQPVVNVSLTAPAQTPKSTEIPTFSPTNSAPDQTINEQTTTAGYTHIQPDGNRILYGTGNLPDLEPLDIQLDGVPKWITALPYQNNTIWAVILTDNRIQTFRVNGRHVTNLFSRVENETPPPSFLQSIDAPPHLRIVGGNPMLLQPPATDSGATHPIMLPDNTLAFISEQGITVGEQTISGINPLPDARLLQDENGRILLLTNPTERYAHGVLGDSIEAAGITLVNTNSVLERLDTITIPAPRVIEGIMPIWVDWNNDGTREIIVTLSDRDLGAQIVLFDEQGNQLATGLAIGQGSRWRHQLAVAPFGPNGEMELVDVLTPHIGGVVEFYQWRGDKLEIVAQVPGYTSHVIGTRNLDMAVAGDLDGNGRYQLLLPNQRRTELAAIQRTADGAEVAWTLPIDGEMVTNLMGITLEDGMLAVGLGRADGTLRVWVP